jgi:hypothetical protein
MALYNICIDLQGWRKCRKIAWSNRGHHIPVGHVGKEREHDCMDRFLLHAKSAFPTSLWVMQEVGRKPLLRFLHSPHPCGLAMQGAIAESTKSGRSKRSSR